MIAILTNEKLENYNDITVLGTIGALLEKQEQSVVSYKDIDFAKLKPDETLYLIEHGGNGQIFSLAMAAVTINETGDKGISQLIGQAIKNAGVKKCPKKIVLKICYSARDLADGNSKTKADLKNLKGGAMASVVRGVAMALAKYKAEQTTVTGYLGPAVLALDEDRKMYVQRPDATFSTTELAELDKKYNFPASIQSVLDIPSIASRARAVAAAPAVRAYNKEFIEFQKKHKTFYEDGKGVVKETAKDGQKHLPPEK